MTVESCRNAPEIALALFFGRRCVSVYPFEKKKLKNTSLATLFLSSSSLELHRWVTGMDFGRQVTGQRIVSPILRITVCECVFSITRHVLFVGCQSPLWIRYLREYSRRRRKTYRVNCFLLLLFFFYSRLLVLQIYAFYFSYRINRSGFHASGGWYTF